MTIDVFFVFCIYYLNIITINLFFLKKKLIINRVKLYLLLKNNNIL